MKNSKRESVASFDSRGQIALGASDVIRWGNIVTINGVDIDTAKAVELGKKYNVSTATLLEEDLKSEGGLLIVFPIAILLDRLQRLSEIQTGEKLLELIKPDDEKAKVEVATENVDGREIINVDYFVKGVKVASVELYVFNDMEEDGADTDEYMVKYYRPEYDDLEDPKILIQGNL